MRLGVFVFCSPPSRLPVQFLRSSVVRLYVQFRYASYFITIYFITFCNITAASWPRLSKLNSTFDGSWIFAPSSVIDRKGHESWIQ